MASIFRLYFYLSFRLLLLLFLPPHQKPPCPAFSNSPSKTSFIALPIAGNSSNIPTKRFIMFCFYEFKPKSINACFGLVNTHIKASPNFANKSVKLPNKALATVVILFHEFLPSSDEVNACFKAPKTTTIAVNIAPKGSSDKSQRRFLSFHRCHLLPLTNLFPFRQSPARSERILPLFSKALLYLPTFL